MLDVAGHRLDQRPGPVLYVGPNKQFLAEQFEPRVMGLLDGAAVLTDKVARGKRMTKTRKLVGGVPFRLAHAGSSTALKSDPAVLALVDEYDEMRSDVNEQGGPLGLVERRGDTYADFVCVVTSTPKRGRVAAVRDDRSGLILWDVAAKEEIDSPIWAIWQQGSRHHWCWPCPHCEGYFVPRFDLLQIPPDATPLSAARDAFIKCPNCHGVIEEQHKADMNERGRYAAPGQSIGKDGVVRGEHREAKSLSYWVSGLCSPFVTIGERAAVYVEAMLSGDPAEVQQAVNGGFGELYSPGGGTVPEWAELKEKSRISDYHHGEVNEDARRLVLTIDVQKQSIPYVIRAWGPRSTSWLVAYGAILGDTAEIDVWDKLADLMQSSYEGMPIDMALIDSGFRPGKVDILPINRIYDFARRFVTRCFITKGASRPQRIPLAQMKPEVKGRDAKPLRSGIRGYMLDAGHWKSWVHERLRWPVDMPGAWNLPRQISDDYCKQIVAEAALKKPNGGVEWVVRSKNNHFLDCEALQAAASWILGMQRIPFPSGRTKPLSNKGEPLPNRPPSTMAADGRKPETQSEVAATTDPTPVPPKPKAPTLRRRRIVRSNFLGA